MEKLTIEATCSAVRQEGRSLTCMWKKNVNKDDIKVPYIDLTFESKQDKAFNCFHNPSRHIAKHKHEKEASESPSTDTLVICPCCLGAACSIPRVAVPPHAEPRDRQII